MSEAAEPVKAKAADAPRELLVSAAPHLSDTATTSRIMFEVLAAMLPLFIWSIYLFGISAVVLVVCTTAGALAAEAVANRVRGRSLASLGDGSAMVTGVILAFSLPPAINPYMAFIGGTVAIILAKAVFGGLGRNLFNPAMVGRAFLMVCFPAAMGIWTEPVTLNIIGDPNIDGVTMATPLGAAMDPSLDVPSLWALFIGKVGGCLGETSTLAALIGGLWLVIRGIADWRPIVGVLGSVFVFASITHWVDPQAYQTPLFHLTSGALMFGAFFIATDYVGAPLTPWGRLIFGIGVGVLVMVIRLYSAYPEGFMFAILIMNAVTPLIERWTVPTPFGGHASAT
ncbi:MAG TPA: RnfABCDGE type electron transport complex subunit D [Phycisphaerae bacterium]|nr:RnfABCDGE type electron transport complex subunit D [Phycisphaerae bacterium]HNU44284.1 RnfABCDGE type electron transport complex subunit D [Phycisphaerae bacterium]